MKKYKKVLPQFTIKFADKNSLTIALYNHYKITATYLTQEINDTDYFYQLSIESDKQISAKQTNIISIFISGFLAGRNSN